MFQGDYGEAWLEAVAASCGLLHGRPTTLDLEKADVELVFPGRPYPGAPRFPAVKVQVKTTLALREDADDYVYDLDAETYNVLCETDLTFHRVLAVIALPPRGDKARLQKKGTLLVGRGAWVSIEGEEPTTNTASQAVRLPKANTIDRRGLHEMLLRYGVRRSTPVPKVDVWGDS
jgi:hypothetical protein